jgi:oligosaccharyltransferase complex subunit gamma
MRLLRSLLTASLLIAGSLAAKKSSTDRFNDFQAKALKTSPIKLGETTYKSLTTAPRDYSVAVLLTALDPRFGCQLCREFQPEWDLLGKSWTKGDKKGVSRMLFGTLDFADGREVFMSVCDLVVIIWLMGGR